MRRMAEIHTVGRGDRLPADYVNPYYIQDLKLRVAVARVGGKLYAFDELCPHGSCPLSAGMLTGTSIMCQCDASKFDITTGAVLEGPATEGLSLYEVREEDGALQVRI